MQPRVHATKVVEIAELDGQQVASPKEEQHLQSNITDVGADPHELRSQEAEESEKDSVNPVALSAMLEMLVVAVSHMHQRGRQWTDSPYTKFVLSNVLNMTRHCYRTFRVIYSAISRYQATGSWPKARNDQAISRFLVEFLQAVVYLVILGFGALVVSRATSYVVFVGSWLFWFARPFAWAFQCVGRALFT